MNILEASFMGVGLAMDALAVSLTLGAVGWSCPKLRNAQRQPGDTGSTETDFASAHPEERPGLIRRLPFLSPTPAAPVCAVCHPHMPCACGCAKAPAAGHAPFTWDKIALTAAFFGAFQAIMPAIGWFGSGLFGGLVQKLGRIAAGILLAVVAAQMLREGFSKEEDPAKKIGVCSLRRLVVLSFATSVDALLVGISYTCLGRTDIAGDVLVIGAVTASISAAGCVCGRMFGNRFGNRSSVLGGLVLFAIAAKIMLFG